MKKIVGYTLCMAALCLMVACSSSSQGESSASMAPSSESSQSAASAESANSPESSSSEVEQSATEATDSTSETAESEAEQMISGTIQDATMNTIVIQDEDGRTLTLSTMDADKSRCNGLLIGSQVRVYYTGELSEGTTEGVQVLRLEQDAQ